MLEQHALWLWFAGFTSALLIGDYVYTKKHLHKDFTLKEVVGLNILWMVFAAIFLGGAMLISASYHGYQLTSGIQENAVLWLTGFVVEKSLAMDNVFVFLIIFAAFSIHGMKQKQILFWGIAAAIVLRVVMIFLAAKIVQEFEWLLIFFGGVLLYLGYKSWPRQEKVEDEGEPSWIVWLKSHVQIRNEEGYVVRDPSQKYGFYITTAFLCLLSIGMIDIIFAVDSIPAIFAITTDEYIVVTSNVLAVLGMAPLFFLLQAIKDKFYYLSHGLSIILVFIGLKLLLLSVFKIPTLLSLAIILTVLFGSMLASYIRYKALK